MSGKKITGKDLIQILSELPNDLPVMFKIDQDICGNGDFSWMRGNFLKAEVETIYLNNNEDEYWDYDRIIDEVYENPGTYGLSDDITENDAKTYVDTKRGETVISVTVVP